MMPPGFSSVGCSTSCGRPGARGAGIAPGGAPPSVIIISTCLSRGTMPRSGAVRLSAVQRQVEALLVAHHLVDVEFPQDRPGAPGQHASETRVEEEAADSAGQPFDVAGSADDAGR